MEARNEQKEPGGVARVVRLWEQASGVFHSAGMISTGTIAGKEMTGWNDPCEMTRESER